MRDQPEPGHKRCNGTGKIFGEGVAARDGLFSHVSPLVHDRGTVEDLLRRDAPFALFFPDRTRLVAAIKDVPETWQALGTTWEAATRAILVRCRASSYVELEFVF